MKHSGDTMTAGTDVTHHIANTWRLNFNYVSALISHHGTAKWSGYGGG
jgi:hypothetical protein